ncbi:MAG: hypothetical protein KBD37_08090 [Burkholderiales bacterium]|jgi:hypothetical protein|nr:hypothetical protein [Burkholderiales bacterium]
MFDYFNIDPNWDIKTWVVVGVIVFLVYLLLLVIPGVGVVVKHITHTITKYVIHPLFHATVVVVGTWILQFFWFLFKHFLFAVKGYCYHLTRTHEKIYPKLAKKKIGVIDE